MSTFQLYCLKHSSYLAPTPACPAWWEENGVQSRKLRFGWDAGAQSHISSRDLGFLVNKGKKTKPALPLSRVLSGINIRTGGAGLCKTENTPLPRHPSLGKPPGHSTHLINTCKKDGRFSFFADSVAVNLFTR